MVSAVAISVEAVAYSVCPSSEFCNCHNDGAAQVAPRPGGAGTPGAHRSEHSPSVFAMNIVVFLMVASAVGIFDEDNVAAAVDYGGTVSDSYGNSGVAHEICDGEWGGVSLLLFR